MKKQLRGSCAAMYELSSDDEARAHGGHPSCYFLCLVFVRSSW
jgi:hypothetical protein